MKKIVILFSAIYSIQTFVFAQSWQRVQLILSSEYTPGLLESKFWGDTGIVVGLYGKVFHSKDFFQTFGVDSTYAGHTLYAMSFANREVGYITSCTVQGGMLKTTDGGNTWNPLPFGPATGVCIGENLLFTTADTAYTAWRESSYYFWFTFDGGQSWNYNSTLPYKEVFKIETVRDSFIYILQVNNLSGILGMLNIYRTSDYGAHWQNTFSTYPKSVTRRCDFHFIDDTTLILAVDAAILKSKDAGFSFDTVMQGQFWYDVIGYNVRSISFVGRDTGFVAFGNSVYKTIDAGDTWVKTDFVFDSIDQAHDAEITFIKAVSSQKVVLGCDRGSIYKTETGGGVWSGIKEAEQVNRIGLYPNPASTQLFIESNGTAVEQINIYNTTGSLVMAALGSTIVNGQLSIAHLPSGVYIADIKTKEGRVRKRWVKM